MESGPQPNILFILVDELRWPSVFPVGINSPEEYFERFMPNLYRHVWKRGVKFSNYYTAACACTPARGTIMTGLYSHQSWLMTTITTNPNVPVLNPAFPTFGKLLQAAGYTTPYFGKWHVSVPNGPSDTAPYGFDWNSSPDPTGYNLQGTYGDVTDTPPFHNDAYTTNQALGYLQNVKTTDGPWCLTIGYVNPHDREFFPAGTEFLTFTNLFANFNQNNPPSDQLMQFLDYTTTPPIVDWDTNQLKSPPSFGYPVLPTNWQNPNNYAAVGKPTTHAFIQQFQEAVWGGVTPNLRQGGFNVAPYGNGDTGFGVGIAPYDYWQRGLDSYTQITQILDQQIGAVLEQLHQLPRSIIDNTVIIFASDHGEYSGAHGFVQGKIGTVYEECMHIPLIVMDPSGRFTDDTNLIRTGLCSSVDLLNMFVTLGHKGDTTWLTQFPNNQIYANRLDMYSMLKSRWAPGRSHALMTPRSVSTRIGCPRPPPSTPPLYSSSSMTTPPMPVSSSSSATPTIPVPNRAATRSSITTSPMSSPRPSPAIHSIQTRCASSNSNPRRRTSSIATSSRTSPIRHGGPATACACCSASEGSSNKSSEPQTRIARASLLLLFTMNSFSAKPPDGSQISRSLVTSLAYRVCGTRARSCRTSSYLLLIANALSGNSEELCVVGVLPAYRKFQPKPFLSIIKIVFRV
jgi:arylsulfatase A-like enzyme